MQNQLITILLLLGTPQAHSSEIAKQPDPRVIEARAIVKEFANELMGRLKTAMATGGPTKAIQTCKLAAPEVASKLSSKHKWQIGRTSLKIRNPENAPDAWEEKVLKDFENRKQKGEAIGSLEYAETQESNETQEFRYMKVIPTTGLCLTCHGTKITESVKASLVELYPKDKAIAFSAGDIRGAFTFILSNQIKGYKTGHPDIKR